MEPGYTEKRHVLFSAMWVCGGVAEVLFLGLSRILVTADKPLECHARAITRSFSHFPSRGWQFRDSIKSEVCACTRHPINKNCVVEES